MPVCVFRQSETPSSHSFLMSDRGPVTSVGNWFQWKAKLKWLWLISFFFFFFSSCFHLTNEHKSTSFRNFFLKCQRGSRAWNKLNTTFKKFWGELIPRTNNADWSLQTHLHSSFVLLSGCWLDEWRRCFFPPLTESVHTETTFTEKHWQLWSRQRSSVLRCFWNKV